MPDLGPVDMDLLEARLAINPALVTEILTRFIRVEITRTGFQRAVFGLSGGIDSSVVAYLAARALGPENVLAVTCPTRRRTPPRATTATRR